MKIAAKTPGKLIILGEYAVLEGAPSLVASTNRFANVLFKKSEDGIFKIEAPSINVPLLKFLIDDEGKIKFIGKSFNKVAEKLSLFTATFEYVSRRLIEKGIKIKPLEIVLDTYDFYSTKNLIKLGLGSSAAVTVSIITGLLSANILEPEEITPEQILKFSIESHRNAQGNIGSGVDIVAAIYGGILKYQIIGKEIQFKQISLPDNLHYLTVWTGKSASTTGYVEKFNKFKKNNPIEFQSIIDEMTKISTEGIEAIEEKRVNDFLENYDKYFYLLKQLNSKIGLEVITLEHQLIYDIARQNGVYYKSSGAGGGDLGILFSDDEKTIKNVGIELDKAGFETLVIQFGTPGIKETKLQGVINAEFTHP